MNNLVPNFLGATQLGCSPVPKIGWTPEDGLYLRIRLLLSALLYLYLYAFYTVLMHAHI